MKLPGILRVTPQNLPALIARLERGRRQLTACGTAAIISAWVAAARKFRQEVESGAAAYLAEATGFHESDIREWLVHLCALLSEKTRWEEWMMRECGRPFAFDHAYGIAEGIAVRRGFERGLVVQGGGIPLTVLPVLAALSLARTPAAVRIGRRDPASLVTFLKTARSVAPLLAETILPVAFSHDDENVMAEVFRTFPLVVAFGSNESLAAMQARVGPQQRFVAFGSRFSLAFIDGDTMKDALATAGRTTSAGDKTLFRRLARDILMFDKQGCFSVQGVILACGDEEAIDGFCERLLSAMVAELRFRGSLRGRLSDASLRSALSAHESIARWAQFGVRKVFAHRGKFFPAVVLMKGSRLPPPSGGPLVWVAAVPSARRAIVALTPYRDFLSTLVLACAPGKAPEIVETFAGGGFYRFCEPGAAQFPSPFAPHDGVPLLSVASQLFVLETPPA